VWDDRELLVTGHDDPVLFRLKLPEPVMDADAAGDKTVGSPLVLIGSEKAPFSGQGIAHDPKTGGLVGIRRGKKQVVFAVREKLASPEAAARRLRILSYNIHHGEGVDGKLDLERIAGVIRAVEPDLVALQEVDKNVPRSGSVDQPAELARLTKVHVVFGANIPLDGGEYGNAVLSRLPVRKHENHKLPCFDGGEQRGVLAVEIDLPGAADSDDDQPLLFLATHLDHRPKDEERLASAKAINELVAKHADQPAILAGDLNAVPESAVLTEFARAWQRSNDEVLPTIPVANPSRQIDYVLLRPASRWQSIETRVLDEAVASDHRPILAVLELRDPRTEPSP
jgi:endonuclease/exonuclease/phosphatase family metal-dependent hydrolase